MNSKFGTALRSPWISTLALLCALALGGAACSDADGERTDNSTGDPDASPAAPDAAPETAVRFRVTVPTSTPPDARVYIAGDFQDWNPADPAYELTRAGDGAYEIVLDLDLGTRIEFKFTRGGWDTVEKGSEGEELDNRVATLDAFGTTTFSVASWADITSMSTITGDVRTLTVPGFLNDRRVWVYLPPGYTTETSQRYPVLYMFDGQNVFDQATSFSGEWRVDESCEELIAAGQMRPIIVVAVDNGGGLRIDEYTPWSDPVYMGGEGDAHIRAFIDVLVPYINQNLRTLTGPDNTGIAGSSLGGLMSLYTGYEFSETFGRVGALSSSLWWDDQHLTQFISMEPKPSSTIYMDMGTIESGSTVDENNNGIDDNIDFLRALRDVMIGQGFVLDSDLMVVEAPGETHSESFWAQRFPTTLQYLFPAP